MGVNCYGHGRCEVLHDGSPLCICDMNRYGHDDDLDTNADGVGNCALQYCSGTVVCHNGGSCVEGQSGATCECPYHYSGPTCETLEPCPEGTSTCVNAVECVAGDGIGECSFSNNSSTISHQSHCVVNIQTSRASARTTTS